MLLPTLTTCAVVALALTLPLGPTALGHSTASLFARTATGPRGIESPLVLELPSPSVLEVSISSNLEFCEGRSRAPAFSLCLVGDSGGLDFKPQPILLHTLIACAQ